MKVVGELEMIEFERKMLLGRHAAGVGLPPHLPAVAKGSISLVLFFFVHAIPNLQQHPLLSRPGPFFMYIYIRRYFSVTSNRPPRGHDQNLSSCFISEFLYLLILYIFTYLLDKYNQFSSLYL